MDLGWQSCLLRASNIRFLSNNKLLLSDMSSQYIEFLCKITPIIYKCYSYYVRGWASDHPFPCQNYRLLSTVAATWTFRRNQKVVVKVVKAPICHWNSCQQHLVSWADGTNHKRLWPHALWVHLEHSPGGNAIIVFFQGMRTSVVDSCGASLSHHFSQCWCDHDILKLKEGWQPLQAEARHASQLNPKLGWHWWPSFNISLDSPRYSWEPFCLGVWEGLRQL